MNITEKVESSPFLRQFVPIGLTLILLGMLTAILHLVVILLNGISFGEHIIVQIRPVDVAVGITIYLKTAIDFAIFIGRLMHKYPGWRNRIAIEIGTALGNALGTILVIIMWDFFKEIDILLAVMVFIASLVLFELAHGSLEHMASWEGTPGIKRSLYLTTNKFLDTINHITDPILRRIMPDLGAKLKGVDGLGWKALLMFSFSVPFILGLDDFAGYVPLFSVVNVYGFSLGVFIAHTILNIALFISPGNTIKAVKNEYVSFVGMLAFILIALYGLFETYRIILHAIW